MEKGLLKAFSFLLTPKDKVFDKVQKIQEWDKYLMYHNQLFTLLPKEYY